jgi:hypothetical protein
MTCRVPLPNHRPPRGFSLLSSTIVVAVLALSPLLVPGIPARTAAPAGRPETARTSAVPASTLAQGQAAGSSSPDIRFTAAVTHTVHLPLITNNYQGLQDRLILEGAQSLAGGERSVLLTWREPPAPARAQSLASELRAYSVYRRLEGEQVWRLIGQAEFASSAQAMAQVIGAPLMDQLAWDLRADSRDAPLTYEQIYQKLKRDPQLARLAAEQYYEVAMALGLAYLDPRAPAAGTLEYRVRSADASTDSHRDISLSPPTTQPGVTGLREAWPGPRTLGQRPSNRPEDAAERYHFDTTQEFRSWDGAIRLVWDLPARALSVMAPVGDESGFTQLGYNVYRARAGTGIWTLVNPRRECHTWPGYEDRYCTLTVRPGSQAREGYFFQDDLAAAFASPNDIYADYDYRVCPVDKLRQEGPCSAVLTLSARELNPPAAVTGLVAEPAEDHSRLTLRWEYGDTSELSPPLRFYITRGSSTTLPLEQWTPVVPKGYTKPYIEVARTTPRRFDVDVTAPKGEVFWYRVQVRDSAGNWSAPSSPAMGALFPRTPPPFPSIGYDSETCANNAMPLQLRGLDPAILAIAVYRSFGPDGPYQLIDHLPVASGRATLDDDYLPPYPADVYYQLEAMDGHGNVSAAQPYCARLNPGTTPPPPSVDWQALDAPGGYWTAQISWDDYTDAAQVVTAQPGPLGVVVLTQTLTAASYSWQLPWGAWVEATVSDVNENGPGEETPVVLRQTNDFMDTDRQMTNLGPLEYVGWATADGKDVARLTVGGKGLRIPHVAAFRRIPGGTWMQVTTVEPSPAEIGPLVITDAADLSASQDYIYVVLALSPTSHEVLGYWGPETLTAQIPDPGPIYLDDGIAPVSGISPECEYTTTPMDSIPLGNGWSLTGVNYWLSDDDPDCPEDMTTFNPDHLYGDGLLSNGVKTWKAKFYDIGIERGTLKHIRGPIVVWLNETPTLHSRFAATFGHIKFDPGRPVRAEVTLTLPVNIKAVRAATGDRSRQVFAVVDDVTPNWSFAPRPVRADKEARLLDENLPWQFDGHYRLTPSEVQFDAGLKTIDRLGYKAAPISNPATPDNNLAFLRPSYTSDGASIGIGGLKGQFDCAESMHYSTSLPAAIVITAFRGASLEVVNSRIRSGRLLDATARLDYINRGTVTDFAVPDLPCTPLTQGSLLCEGYLQGGGAPPPGLSYGTLDLRPHGEDIAVGPGGLLTSTATLDGETPAWNEFATSEEIVTLYVAAAAFDDQPTTSAPMPAENAWRQLTVPGLEGDLDPGVNINVAQGHVDWSYTQPPGFDNVYLDLYVRRGGVSEYLLAEPPSVPTGRRNNLGYATEIVRLELLFVDNGRQILDWQEDLFLPYPSDVILHLQGAGTTAGGEPFGSFRPPVTALHKYWRFEQIPDRWRYTSDLSSYGGALGSQRALFAMHATTTINGLSRQSADQAAVPVVMEIETEWLPDGDFGDVAFEPGQLPAEGFRVSGVYFAFSDIKLSRYHTVPLNTASLPDTLGLGLADNMAALHPDLLAGGQLTGLSLRNCAQPGNQIGCGFVLLDGDGAVEYFGEIGQDGAAAQAPALLPADQIHGDFPVASNQRGETTQQAVVRPPQLTWNWPLVNNLLQMDIPVKFMGNSDGGALVGVWRDASLLPFLEVFRADLAIVAVFDWKSGAGFDDKIGIFTGYSASQAAFRALAVNRPPEPGSTSTFRPFDKWPDVAQDVASWATKFGYTYNSLRSDSNDPVDLARDLWEGGWCLNWTSGDVCTHRVDLEDTYKVLVPFLQAMDGEDAYNGSGITGVTGLEAGSILQLADTSLNTGTGQALFVPAGRDLRLENLYFGAQVIIEAQDEPLLDAAWLSLEYDRDGLITVKGEDLDITLPGGYEMTANLLLLVGTQDGSEFIEGGVTVDRVTIAELVLRDLGVAFGAGRINYQTVAYLGLTGEAEFAGYEVGGSVLFGYINPDSEVLRMAGFGDLLDSLSDGETPSQKVLAGFYLAFHGEFPLVEGSCLLEAEAGGELRLWFFWNFKDSRAEYGGQLSGEVHATVACLISARGNLSLAFAEIGDGATAPVPPGESPGSWPLTRVCHNPGGTCTYFGGSFWIAVGVGWCEPGSWRSWGGRWWGDSWCYTFGAWAALTYLTPPESAGKKWQYDYDLDFE